MADSTWDWWFGDGPPSKIFSRTRLNRWIRSKRLRRWLLSASIVGTIGFSSYAPAIAGPPSGQTVVSPVSFGWATPSPMAVLLASQSDDNKPKNADADATDPNARPADADEQRRQRLRDLLRVDDKDKGSETDDANVGRSDGGPADSDDDDLFADPFIEERLPEVSGGRFILPPLRAVSIAQEPIGNGRVPEALNAGDELTLVPLPEDAFARSELNGSAAWPSLVRPWAAPNTYSHPLFFEDRMLERHGHERWGCLQPIASGARFFATVPMLPYLTTITNPCETVYSKGYFRSGSPVPRLYQRPPLERRAIIVQSAATAAGFIALP